MNDYDDRPRSGLAALALLLAVAALVGLVIAPLGYKQGWWDYDYALLTVIKYAAFTAAAAVLLGVMGLGHTWFGGNRRGMPLALLAIIIAVGTLITPVKQLQKFRSLPVIHDISTDSQNPPAFEASVAVRGNNTANSTAYAGDELAKAQSCAYDSLAPLRTGKDPETVFPIALELIKQQGWELLAADSRRGRIEAVDQSRWFGFKDDIVLRVARSEAGSTIDMRSSSRVGKSDLGVNAERVEAFLSKLSQAIGD